MSDLLDHLTNAQVHLTEGIRLLQQQENGKPGLPVIPPAQKATVSQITNAPPTGWVVHEYSTICPFNQNNSAILLVHEGGFFDLYNGAGQFYRTLPSEVHASSRPRWSRSSPNLFTYLHGNTIKQFDLSRDWSSNAMSTLHTFAQFKAIDDGGEADVSEDGDHRVLVGDDQTVFVYRIGTDTILGSATNTGYSSDYSAYMTPDNNVLIPGQKEIKLFDKTMKFIRSIKPPGGHLDTTRDFDGSECLIMGNGNENPVTFPGPGFSVIKIRLADGKQSQLLGGIDWSLATHYSGPAKGFGLVTTYKPDESKPDTTYTNKIIKVPVDGSKATILAEHHSRPFNRYQWEPQASVSRDGSRFVFRSNEGVKQPNNPEWSNVFLGVIP